MEIGSNVSCVMRSWEIEFSPDHFHRVTIFMVGCSKAQSNIFHTIIKISRGDIRLAVSSDVTSQKAER